MSQQQFLETTLDGWEQFQQNLCAALKPLSDEQLALRAAPKLRPVSTIAAHIIGARARWMIGIDERAEWGPYRSWDRRGSPSRSARELVEALETTWQMLRQAVEGWSDDDWARTWPGEDDEPETLTPHWILWHLIEHDVYHGGEISMILGSHGVRALSL